MAHDAECQTLPSPPSHLEADISGAGGFVGLVCFFFL